MIQYEIFDQGSFLIIKYSGKIDMNTFESFLKLIFKNKNKNSFCKALSDFRDAELTFTIQDLNDIIKLRVASSEGFSSSIKSVYLVHDVRETVYTTLYANEISKEIAGAHICSTIEYAIKYLNLKTSISELEGRINTLENTFLMK